jgi:DNA-binding transcriptional MocR family regulator
MALWAQVAKRVDVDAWQARALEARVMFQPARLFTLDGASRPYARFGYSLLNEAEIPIAVERLSRVVG